jgi:hypothetical protein
LRGASVTIAAGSAVNGVDGVETLGVDADVVCAGAGAVATVAGAPHATIASDRRTSGDDNDFIGDPWMKNIVEQ